MKILFPANIYCTLIICMMSMVVPRLQFAQPHQTLKVRRLSTRDGLSSNAIWCLFQDSKGFMWVGTDAGLDKYDGYSFAHYLQDLPDTIDDGMNWTKGIIEDKGGTIWTGRTALASLDRKTGKGIWYVHDNDNSPVKAMLFDSKGRLWIGYASGELDLCDTRAKTFKHYHDLSRNFPEFKNFEGITKITEREDGCLILAHQGYWNPVIFDPERGTFTQTSEISVNAGSGFFVQVPTDRVNKKSISIYSDTIHRTVVLFESTPFHLSTNRIVIPQDLFSFVNVWKNEQLIYGGNHKYWFPSGISGLLEIDFANGTVSPISILDETNSPVRIIDIYQAQDGAIWMRTTEGIYIADRSKNLFHTFVLHSDLKPEIRYSVNTLVFDNVHTLWAGARPGSVFRYDSMLSNFREAMQFPANSPYPKPAAINHMVQDLNSRLWITCRGGTLYCSEPPFTRLVRRFEKPLDFNGEINGSTWGATVDSNGILWTTFMSYDRKIRPALVRVDPNTMEVNRYPSQGDSAWGRGLIASVHDRNKNTLWVGSADGLAIFDKHTRKFIKKFAHQNGNNKSISEGPVFVLFTDHKNRLWLSTVSDGLNLFNEKEETFIHFRKSDGLPDNRILSILEDSVGNLWLGTANGISCFNPDRKTFTNYNTDDGILDDVYFTNSAAISSSGEFFFGGVRGITSFYPRQMQKTETKFPLYLTNFKVFDSLKYGELLNGDTVNLSYKDNYFSLDASYLDFKDPIRKRYEYILEGYDKLWVAAGNRRTISYNNVEPGNYILRVRVYLEGEKQIQNEIYASIIITPPFWQKWWFRLVAGLLAVVAVGSVFNSRRKRRNELQNQLDDARESERVNLAGELHDGPLQDLYGARFLLDPLIAESGQNMHATELDILLRKVRSDLRAMTGELQLPQFESGFAEELHLFCGVFAERHPNIRVIEHITPEGKPLSLIAKQNLFRLFRTAMANVAKHANATEVEIIFVTREDVVTLKITDNGSGFTVPEDLSSLVQSKHYGLFLMHSYASSIKAKCSVLSKPGIGTEVGVVV